MGGIFSRHQTSAFSLSLSRFLFLEQGGCIICAGQTILKSSLFYFVLRLTARWFTDENDFKYTDKHKYKASPKTPSKYVHVLLLATSSSAMTAKKQNASTSIRWPRSQFSSQMCKPSSSEDNAVPSQKAKEKQKHSNNVKSMDTVMKAYQKEALKVLQQQPPPAQHNLKEKSSPIVNTGDKGAASSKTAVASPRTFLSSSDFALIRQQLYNGIHEDLCSQIADQLRDDIASEVQQRFAVEKAELVNLKSEVSQLIQEQQSFLESIRQEVSAQEQGTKNTFDGLFHKMEKKIRNLESRVGNKETDVVQHQATQGPAHVARVTLKASPGEQIDIGEGVLICAEYWATAKKAVSKEAWVSNIFYGLFKDEAKFYRCRQPRTQDTRLKVIPSIPPYLVVVREHFREWLRNNPKVLDEWAKPKQRKDEVLDPLDLIIAHRQWDKQVREESEPDKKTRRAARLVQIVKSLESLIGDRAQELYRVGQPRGAKRAKVPSPIHSKERRKRKKRRCEYTSYKSGRKIVNSSDPDDQFEPVDNSTEKTVNVEGTDFIPYQLADKTSTPQKKNVEDFGNSNVSSAGSIPDDDNEGDLFDSDNHSTSKQSSDSQSCRSTSCDSRLSSSPKSKSRENSRDSDDTYYAPEITENAQH
ncbi:uncharacterized protein LOC127750403 isoform X2 [Frankliniella occidentalis]|uniref:Uncharacterized protein LOC113203709 isoform X2 n=1 Tax=Frankliniella occidentalis TaxID=133901 RepID=A0A6J1S6D7_FRAOC|nr:uncharacterized protein LOC113203709 isoform X2 [Frankliniella occidentalis]XP_052127971.1 uncharacterized protein LOC127750397 isoform X2 [Frankliniella occidentalis]XP_052127992.1 uncharacterized protein LOC127750403 isoform X2 [Frankliniella occidentalis]